jgi:hypothetical protein
VTEPRPSALASLQTQAAPTPDYGSGLPPGVERCSCEEALALRARIAELQVPMSWQHERDAANARAEAAERQCQRNARIEQQNECDLRRAESDAVALRAEVERLREEAQNWMLAWNEATAHRAEARALLERCHPCLGFIDQLRLDVGTWLATNPESARAPIERHPVRHIPEDQLAPIEHADLLEPIVDKMTDLQNRIEACRRTDDHERAVLEAMAKEDIHHLLWCANNLVNLKGLLAACKAELARRKALLRG